MCVCSHLIYYSGRQTTCGRMHQPGSHNIQEKSHTGFFHLPSAVLPLIFLARRIRSSLSLVEREVEFCVQYPRINRSPLVVGHAFFFFFVRKNPSSCDCTEIRTHVLTSSEVSLPTEPPGRPTSSTKNNNNLDTATTTNKNVSICNGLP